MKTRNATLNLNIFNGIAKRSVINYNKKENRGIAKDEKSILFIDNIYSIVMFCMQKYRNILYGNRNPSGKYPSAGGIAKCPK